MAGLWFEEFETGRRFVHEIRRTVTETDNVLFSTLTHNPAAIHLDHAYAAKTEFGRPLVNSLFTLGLVVGDDDNCPARLSPHVLLYIRGGVQQAARDIGAALERYAPRARP